MNTTPSSRPVMIVTGASAGIGYALSEAAAHGGFDVFATGRRADRLAQLKHDCIGLIGEIETLSLDLRTPNAAQRIVGATLKRFGRVDVLVNNAGVVAVGRLTEQSDTALREQFEIHVLIPIELTRAALPALRTAQGHVVYVGSGVARVPQAGLGAYPTAKAAVPSLARIVRNELRSDGITVSYVDPGAVDTEFMRRAGLAGSPPSIAATPQHVALRILDGIRRRKRVINAVPWQAAFVALGSLFPDVTDALLTRIPQIVGGQKLAGALEPASALPSTTDAPPQDVSPQSPPPAEAASSPFASALAPLAARMRKMNLPEDFLAKLLRPGATLELGEVAMGWAGMPNKHERALTHDVLEALVAAGFLRAETDQAYAVVRNPD